VDVVAVRARTRLPRTEDLLLREVDPQATDVTRVRDALEAVGLALSGVTVPEGERHFGDA